ncbi:MAG: hypothetical protein IJP27_04795 [Clostridia bacterium]|nr:hypothetical protein [Clostridia bacterium]
MKTNEQFKAAVFARCARKRQTRRRITATLFSGCLCVFLLSCTAFVVSLPDPQEKRPEPPAPLPMVEICSPDSSVVYFTFTKQEEVDALIACRPIPPAENTTSDTMKSDPSLTAPSFLVRYTDADGTVHCLLIGNYSADAEEEWQICSPENAAPLIEKLKELGCEIS